MTTQDCTAMGTMSELLLLQSCGLQSDWQAGSCSRAKDNRSRMDRRLPIPGQLIGPVLVETQS